MAAGGTPAEAPKRVFIIDRCSDGVAVGTPGAGAEIGRLVDLPHPRTGRPRKFMVSSGGRLSELVQIAPPEAHRAFFVGDEVISDGRLYVVTAFDAVFFLLPLLTAPALEGRFVPAAQITSHRGGAARGDDGDDDDAEAAASEESGAAVLASVLAHSPTTEATLASVCDSLSVAADGAMAYRLNREKALDVLCAKVRTVAAVFETRAEASRQRLRASMSGFSASSVATAAPASGPSTSSAPTSPSPAESSIAPGAAGGSVATPEAAATGSREERSGDVSLDTDADASSSADSRSRPPPASSPVSASGAIATAAAAVATPSPAAFADLASIHSAVSVLSDYVEDAWIDAVSARLGVPSPLKVPPAAYRRALQQQASTASLAGGSPGTTLSAAALADAAASAATAALAGGGGGVSAAEAGLSGPVDKAAMWHAKGMSDDSSNLVGRFVGIGARHGGGGGDDGGAVAGGKRKVTPSLQTAAHKRLAATNTKGMKTMGAFFGGSAKA